MKFAIKLLHFNNPITNIYYITTMINHIFVIYVVVRLKNYQHYIIMNEFTAEKNPLNVKLVVTPILFCFCFNNLFKQKINWFSDKSFRQRVSYLVHKRIHTGVMPYKCTICDKSFRYKVSQRTHKCTNIIISNVQQKQQQQSSEIIVQSPEKDLLLSLSTITKVKSSIIDYTIDDDLTNQTLDELVAESCTKLGIGQNNNNIIINEQQQQNVSSPTVELENLCIYSPIQFPDLSDI